MSDISVKKFIKLKIKTLCGYKLELQGKGSIRTTNDESNQEYVKKRLHSIPINSWLPFKVKWF